MTLKRELPSLISHRVYGIRRINMQWVILASIAAILPLVLSPFNTGIVSLCLPLILLAFSIDLLWGENKIVSFGHGAFFAAGGYAAGLVLKGPAADTSGVNLDILSGSSKQESTLDVAAQFFADQTVFGVPVLALVIAVVCSAFIGGLVGLAVFRLADAELYAPLITLGVGVIASTAFLSISEIGGSNGLSGIPGYTLQWDGPQHQLTYWFNLSFVVIVGLLYSAYRNSWRGRRWRASGDDPLRLEALGSRVGLLRTGVFTVSAALAGLAGALYVGTSGYMSASFAGVAFSVQALIWVAVGGAGRFSGPIVGVLVVQLGQQYLSSWLESYWQLFLGVALLVVVLTTSDGIVGAFGNLSAALSRQSRSSRQTSPDSTRKT